MSPVRTAAGRLTIGTRDMAGTFGNWLLPGDFRASASRLAGCSVGGALAWTVVDRVPQLMGVAAAGLVIGAWCAGAPAPAADDQEQPEQEPDDEGITTAELVAALHHVANPHVHLVPLSQHLGLGNDTAPVRALLADAGIPVAKGVRVAGRVSPGVKAADIPPLPAPTPDTPVGRCSAGQRDNNNSNSLILERPVPGMLIIRDPAETALRRTNVQHP